MKELIIKSPTDLRTLTDRFNFIKAIDLETTGLSSANDKVIEYGSYTTDFCGNEVCQMQQLINPGIEVPTKVTEITGLSTKDVQMEPDFKSLALKIFYDMVTKSSETLVIAHNAKFDMGFLTQEFARIGIDMDLIDVTYLCTRDTSRFLVNLGIFDNKGSNGLQHLMEVFGFDDPNHHRSINDCIMCNRLLRKFRELV